MMQSSFQSSMVAIDQKNHSLAPPTAVKSTLMPPSPEANDEHESMCTWRPVAEKFNTEPDAYELK